MSVIRTGLGKVVVNRAISLDGFIAGRGDDMGWIPDVVPQAVLEEQAAKTGAMLVGRRTWEVADRMQAEGPGATTVP